LKVPRLYTVKIISIAFSFSSGGNEREEHTLISHQTPDRGIRILPHISISRKVPRPIQFSVK
jgi:hypothetical protein